MCSASMRNRFSAVCCTRSPTGYRGRPLQFFDVMHATDSATGQHREIWFDISVFFGKGL